MYVTIINDCCDEGTMNRQVVRASTLFPNAHISHVGVASYSDLEAAGLIIDTLDAAQEEEGIILANVAPRHGKAKKWENGTPFGHIQIGNTHLFSTIDGVTLSLVHKYGLAKEVEVYDIPTVLDHVIAQGFLSDNMRTMITDTQFRSYEFLPRVARWFLDGVDIPFEKHALADFQTAPLAIWFVDNFGNCKTCCWAEDIKHEPGKKIKTNFGEITCYARLKDVPNGAEGLTIGSSGLQGHRFVELVVQGQSAAAHFKAKVGDLLIP